MNAIGQPDHYIKFSFTKNGNGRGTREFGNFEIHSSTQLFPVFGVNYFGTAKMQVELQERNRALLEKICGLYGVGGQSLTCNDGTRLPDNSFLYKGSYDCFSD